MNTMTFNILNQTYTRKNIGHCYNREDRKILVEGIHGEDAITDFANDYLRKHPIGQMYYYDGFNHTADGNTEVFVHYLIDSSD